jgi:pyruvate kinase
MADRRAPTGPPFAAPDPADGAPVESASAAPGATIADLRAAVDALSREVRTAMRSQLAEWPDRRLPRDLDASRANLAAYLALRRHDIRGLQDSLARLGVSSLGRSEAHVRASIASVATILAALDGIPGTARRAERLAGIVDGQSRLLDARATALLGPERTGRRTRIIVTLPGPAPDDGGLVEALVRAGMDVARINAAHDHPDAWRALAARVRAAATATGRRCVVMIDLPGPKLRIGPFERRAAVVRLRRPEGSPGPARFVLETVGAEGGSAAGASERSDGHGAPLTRVPVVDADWLAMLRPGDRIELRDARGKSRRLVVEGRLDARSVSVATERRTDLVEGLELARRWNGTVSTSRVGPLAPVPVELRVTRGDRLILARGRGPGRAARLDRNGRVLAPAVIGCLQPGLVDAIRVGDPVLIDDGRIRTRVESIGRAGAVLRVARTRQQWERIRADQGLNVPRSDLTNPGLTDVDQQALDVAAEVADVVAVSFVQSPDDIDRVCRALDERGVPRIGVVAKIETRLGVEALPDVVVAGLGPRPFGVMIARGDLAVEIGYERLAEMQEELLWLCEAAHVPVIWATQVLETLIKTGLPSRAEVTDAAMSERAEGVMLNKGPFILEGLAMLDDIVVRMEAHQHKKTPRLRALRSW